MSPDAIEQDLAAGGRRRRRIRLKNGDEVTVSMSLRKTKDDWFSVTLRFKRSGMTFQRSVGKLPDAPRDELLRSAWELARENRVVEQDGWTWIEQDA
jgi:hypothetical protein